MSDNFDIEELLKKHLTDASEPGPLGLFDQIEAEILEKKKRKRRFFFWFWTLGMGMCLGTVLVLFNINGDHQNQTVENGKPGSDLELRKEYPANSTEPARIVEANTEDTIETESTSITQESPISNIVLTETDNRSEDPILLASTNTGGSSHAPEIDPESGIAGTEMDYNNSNSNSDENGEVRDNTTGEASNTEDNNNTDTVEDHPTNTVLNTNTHNVSVEDSSVTITNDRSDQNLVASETTDTIGTVIENDQAKLVDTPSETINTTEDPATADTSLDIDTTQLALNTAIDSSTTQTDSSDRVENNLPKTDSTQNPEAASKKFGISFFGGPTAFDIALFKPYFSSGVLSNRSFSSSGFELGLGIERYLGQRFKLQFIGTFNQKQTNFTYNLMIGESDFFNLYEANELIPLENLDDPNSCNCFLAEDASLDYTLSTVYLSIGASFDLIQTPRHRFGPQFEFSSNLSNGFKIASASVLDFNNYQNEQFTSLRMGLGLAYSYGLTDHLFLGIRPTYYYQFNDQSVLLASPLKELFVPFTATLTF